MAEGEKLDIRKVSKYPCIQVSRKLDARIANGIKILENYGENRRICRKSQGNQHLANNFNRTEKGKNRVQNFARLDQK